MAIATVTSHKINFGTCDFLPFLLFQYMSHVHYTTDNFCVCEFILS